MKLIRAFGFALLVAVGVVVAMFLALGAGVTLMVVAGWLHQYMPFPAGAIAALFVGVFLVTFVARAFEEWWHG